MADHSPRRRRSIVTVLCLALFAGAASCGADERTLEAGTSAGSFARAPTEVRTVRCDDGARTWTASVEDVDAPAAPGVVLVELTGPEGGGLWHLVTTRAESRERLEVPVDASDAPGMTARYDEMPRLVSPDQRCTLYLSPFPDRSDAEPVVVIGDSIAAGLVATSDDRALLEARAAARGIDITVDGQSGAPFHPLDPAGANLDDELRGAAALSPDVTVVVVLGANDALLAALAPDAEKIDWRRRSDEAMTSALASLVASGRCVVLTTPPDAAITQFGLEESYALESVRVGDVLRGFGGDRRFLVADFATDSRAHHLQDDAPDDWFSEPDELHPNAAGNAGLLDLLLDATQQCPER